MLSADELRAMTDAELRLEGERLDLARRELLDRINATRTASAPVEDRLRVARLLQARASELAAEQSTLNAEIHRRTGVVRAHWGDDCACPCCLGGAA